MPYPVDLSDQRREMIHLILEPTRKFMEEINNPAEFVLLHFHQEEHSLTFDFYILILNVIARNIPKTPDKYLSG